MDTHLTRGIWVCQVVMPMPENYETYHQEVASSHPDLTFRELSRRIQGKGVMTEEISVKGSNIPYGLLHELRQGKGVKRVDPLEASIGYSVYRLFLDVAPITNLARQMGLRVNYPIRFEGRVSRFLVIAEEGKVAAFYARVKELAPKTTLAIINPDVIEGREILLTHREKDLLKIGLETGFWERSPGLNLRQLARIARLAKSGASRTIASIERKLLYHVSDRDLARF